MVSHKRNATRKRLLAIHHYKSAQMVFMDTPGIHRQENMLGKFMLEESLKALGDCDIVLFLIPISDDIGTYIDFLDLNKKKKKHIIILTKTDRAKNKYILSRLGEYNRYSSEFISIIPCSINQDKFKNIILDEVYKNIDDSPFMYDEEYMTTTHTREIYKEFIREAIFSLVSDEVPYGSDVLMQKVIEGDDIYKIYADIVVETNSHKKILIGKNGDSVKRIRIYAQKRIEEFTQSKVYLSINIVIKKSWSKNKQFLKEIGYDVE